MVMRAMRDSAKWVMLILSIAFVGWLVLDWVQSRQSSAATGPNPVVLTVNGQEIRLAQWSQFLEGRLDVARTNAQEPLTDEQVRQIREASWEALISQVLLDQELDRLSIHISDAEIQEAFRTTPPPDLMGHPAFQTDGRFDYEKYRQFFADQVVDEVLLLQIESYYRGVLPRQKLAERIQSSVYVSDDEVWRAFRDRSQTARVRFVSVDPATDVDAAEITVGDDEIRAYYREHRDDYERPATAVVNIVSLSASPSAADSATTAARADSIRRLIVAGEADFVEVASTLSADQATAASGGSLGRFARGDLAGPLGEAAFTTAVGELSEPILSPRGYHLLRVDTRSGDTATASHILFEIGLSDDTEDALFDVLDELEGIALDQNLRVAADSLSVPIRESVTLTEDTEFVPGAGALGVGVDTRADVAESTGWPEQVPQPFTRIQCVPGLGRATEAVGEAIGLPVGQIGGPADAGETVVLLEVLERSEPSLEAFEAAKEGLRAQLTIQQQQQQLGQWLQGLRDRAEVRDLRDRRVQQTKSPFGTS